MFTSYGPYHAQNLADGKNLSVVQARLKGPDGDVTPGIAVFNGRHLKFCIPTEDAIRIAMDIANAAEGHR